jgi:hypothetical protein
MGCVSVVEVRFQPAITEAGRYAFTITANGEESTCEVDFDLSRSASRSGACAGLLAEGTRSNDNSTAGGEPFAIIGFNLAPATTVAVRVSREGTLWADSTFEPAFENVEINGPGCGGCPIAREDVILQ